MNRSTLLLTLVPALALALAPACAQTTEAALCPCDDPEAATSYDGLHAAAWVQTAAEFAAGTRQSFAAATRRLPALVADANSRAALEQQGDVSGLPPAVIVDVDETLLDNSPQQAWLMRSCAEWSLDTWAEWVDDAVAEPIPGAVEFAQAAAREDVTVFYVTNRMDVREDATRRNLDAVGFPLDPERDTILSRTTTGEKGERRREVAKTHRIVMLVGDNLGDFVDLDPDGDGVKLTRAERDALVARHAARWGDQWILLPNPMYGSWRSAVSGTGGTRAAKRRLELDALDAWGGP